MARQSPPSISPSSWALSRMVYEWTMFVSREFTGKLIVMWETQETPYRLIFERRSCIQPLVHQQGTPFGTCLKRTLRIRPKHNNTARNR